MSRSGLAVAVALFAVSLAGCMPPDTVASNKELIHEYHVAVWEQHDLSSYDGYFSPDFVSHANPPGTPPGPDSGKQFMQALYYAFPDLASQEDGVLGDADKVAIQWTVTGTQTGPLFGMPATGKAIQVSGMDVLRVEGGQFVEHWGGIGDQFPKIYAQLQQ
ncbi:MAG TPA: ester cyclase [Myxococcales bacterium]|jgi:predicted ester cyclase|nr:ester cyclase [Myxococcales bacterium]